VWRTAWTIVIQLGTNESGENKSKQGKGRACTPKFRKGRPLAVGQHAGFGHVVIRGKDTSAAGKNMGLEKGNGVTEEPSPKRGEKTRPNLKQCLAA